MKSYVKDQSSTLKFHANGKLLISGEYAVLDGAYAWAIPTKYGQSLEVKSEEIRSSDSMLNWCALSHDGEIWLSAKFKLKTLEIVDASDQKMAEELKLILQTVGDLQPNIFDFNHQDINCQTKLEFPKDWGLGSSSTLIQVLANWCKIDAFALNRLTFQTSGYDIACASNYTPILYRNLPNEREIIKIDFLPKFSENLYFIHLNQKQHTKSNVSKNYKSLPRDKAWIESVSQVSKMMVDSENQTEFSELMNEHENLISSKLNLPKVKDLYFSDFDGSIKSLGAWGGDFIMATGNGDIPAYFHSKGFPTIFTLNEILYKK